MLRQPAVPFPATMGKANVHTSRKVVTWLEVLWPSLHLQLIKAPPTSRQCPPPTEPLETWPDILTFPVWSQMLTHSASPRVLSVRCCLYNFWCVCVSVCGGHWDISKVTVTQTGSFTPLSTQYSGLTWSAESHTQRSSHLWRNQLPPQQRQKTKQKII